MSTAALADAASIISTSVAARFTSVTLREAVADSEATARQLLALLEAQVTAELLQRLDA